MEVGIFHVNPRRNTRETSRAISREMHEPGNFPGIAASGGFPGKFGRGGRISLSSAILSERDDPETLPNYRRTCLYDGHISNLPDSSIKVEYRAVYFWRKMAYK